MMTNQDVVKGRRGEYVLILHFPIVSEKYADDVFRSSYLKNDRVFGTNVKHLHVPLKQVYNGMYLKY